MVRSAWVLLRSTFIIDKTGTVRHAMYNVKPKGHAEECLKWCARYSYF